jgi:ketosteroid isomerase-like protein
MAQQAEQALEQETRRILERLDALDMEALGATFTDDAQGIDELTRGWRRGRKAINAYLSELAGTVSDVRSQATDLHATSWGDTGVVTFVLEQTYQMDGETQSLSAPTSLVFRRQDDGWKVALIHSAPLPE